MKRLYAAFIIVSAYLNFDAKNAKDLMGALR
jgi:hypothetical protein